MSAKKTRIMYIEDKSAGLNGSARIGRVTFQRRLNRSTIKAAHFSDWVAMASKPITLTLRQAISFGFPGREKVAKTDYTHQARGPLKSTQTFTTNIGMTFEAALRRNDSNG